jgi:hypothetical protein
MLQVLALTGGLLALATAAPAAEDEPVKKIDRAKVVGPPVLDGSGPAGFYIWLEDGWYQLAAVTNLPFGTKKRMTRTYHVAIASTKDLTEKLGAFKKESGAQREIKLTVVVGATVERARFKTDGDVTISAAADGNRALPIYVGPLSKRGAATVRIGRF